MKLLFDLSRVVVMLILLPLFIILGVVEYVFVATLSIVKGKDFVSRCNQNGYFISKLR